MSTVELYKSIYEELSDRTSNKTISDHWKKIKEISLVISSVSGAALGVITALSLTPPGWIITTISVISVVSLNVAGRAQIDKSKKYKK